MSLRLEMLQVARLAPKALGDSAALVREFLLRQITPEGGGADRVGKADLYYTIFVLAGLEALQAELVYRPRLFEFRKEGGGVD